MSLSVIWFGKLRLEGSLIERFILSNQIIGLFRFFVLNFSSLLIFLVLQPMAGCFFSAREASEIFGTLWWNFRSHS